ncbi:MAG TPA: hypothetical protein VGK56_16695 [Anaerolineales bacterium]
MNTKRLYVLTAVNHAGPSLLQKMFLASLVVALLVASLPVASAFAAPASKDQPWENLDLKREWKNKLRQLSTEGLFYNQVRFYPADFEDSSELARAWDLLHKHGFALRQANTVVLNHAGFDFEGNVLNERQAYESVHDLAMYLQMMRGYRMKIAEEGYQIRRVR